MIQNNKNSTAFSLTMDDLKKFDGNPPTQAIHRKNYVNIEYGKHIQLLKKAGITPSEYIMRKILDEYNDKIIITKNRFPYDIDNSILHLLVWINPMFDITEEYIRKMLKMLDNDPLEFVMFENLPSHRSIPNIKHFHLFINKNDAKRIIIEPEF